MDALKPHTTFSGRAFGLGCRLLLLAVAAANACLVVGCSRKNPVLPSYGLALATIDLDPDNTAQLNSNVWAKKAFTGTAALAGTTFKANISYSGKSTIDAFKKSFELQFADGKRWQGRSAYRVSAQAADPTGIRSLLGFQVYADAGLFTPRIEPCAAYFNGQFAGLYQLIEPIDEEFLKVRGITPQSTLKAIFGNATFGKENLARPELGFDDKMDPEFYGDLYQLIAAVNREADATNRASMEQLLDVDNFLHYLAATTLLDQWDGYTNNFFLYRSRGKAPFRFVPWDLDRMYDMTSTSGIYQPGVSLFGRGQLAAFVLAFPDIRQRYIAILRDLVTTRWPRARVLATIDTWSAHIADAYAADRTLTAGGKTSKAAADAMKTNVNSWFDGLEADLKSL